MPLGVDVVARNTVVAMIVVVDVVDWDHWVLSLVQIASVFQASKILDATHSHVRKGVVEGLANGSLANLFLAEPQGNPETAETGSEGSPDVGEKSLFLREQSHDPFIAVVGCFQGFRTKGGADSVGRQTTRSVVQSIFLVIVADALFSVAFSALDL